MFKLISLKCLYRDRRAVTAGQPVPVQGNRPDYTRFQKEPAPFDSRVGRRPWNGTSDVKGDAWAAFADDAARWPNPGITSFLLQPMEETFKQNGLTTPTDIHEITPAKLHDIFGADAALYTTVSQYGSVYTVLDSTTIVAASARLVDLRTGDLPLDGIRACNRHRRRVLTSISAALGTGRQAGAGSDQAGREHVVRRRCQGGRSDEPAPVIGRSAETDCSMDRARRNTEPTDSHALKAYRSKFRFH